MRIHRHAQAQHVFGLNRSKSTGDKTPRQLRAVGGMGQQIGEDRPNHAFIAIGVASLWRNKAHFPSCNRRITQFNRMILSQISLPQRAWQFARKLRQRQSMQTRMQQTLRVLMQPGEPRLPDFMR